MRIGGSQGKLVGFGLVAVALQFAQAPPALAAPGPSFIRAFHTEGHLKQAAGLGTDNLGNVYVADGAANRVVKFDKEGFALLSFGQGNIDNQGTAGHLWLPADVTVANGVVYVVDAANQVNVFSTGGDSLGRWPLGPEDLSGPLAVTSDCAGNIYVADARHNRIVEFDPNGTRIRTFGPGDIGVPSGIAIDQTFSGGVCTVASIYVSDEYSHNIVQFSGTGELIKKIGEPGQGPLQFGGPEHLALDRESPVDLTLWVSEAGNMRAQRLVSSDGGGHWSYGGEVRNGTEPIGDTHALTLTPQGHLLVGNALGTIYEYAIKAPGLTFDSVGTRSLVRNQGKLRYQVKYNQVDKICNVLVTAKVAIPRHAFTLEERVKDVGSLQYEFARLDLTDKQLGWLKKAWKAGDKVPVHAVAKGSCTDKVHVTKHEDIKI